MNRRMESSFKSSSKDLECDWLLGNFLSHLNLLFRELGDKANSQTPNFPCLKGLRISPKYLLFYCLNHFLCHLRVLFLSLLSKKGI